MVHPAHDEVYTVWTVFVIDNSLQLTNGEAKAKFPKRWRAIKPYLRLTPQPNR